MNKLFTFNEELKKFNNIFIYGTSSESLTVFSAMLKRNIYIKAFCSLDASLSGITLMNKKVIRLEQISDYDNSVLLLYGRSEYIDIINEKNIETAIYVVPEWINGVRNELITRTELWSVIKACYNKKIIIYGYNDYGKEIARLMFLCDIDVAYYVDDENDEEVKSAWELLYEDPEKIFIIIAKDDCNMAINNLLSMGLEEVRQFRMMQNLIDHYQMRWYLDVQLGHTYKIAGESVYGIKTYQSTIENDIKIVLLGGSTTDPQLYPFKSWGELLFERFREENKAITIINAGCSSYTSSQELLKLERDLLLLKPDVVVSYSGVNDIIYDDEYKFASSFQRSVYDVVGKRMVEENNANRKRGYAGISNGIRNYYSAFDWWLKCEKLMHAVCGAENIIFIGILQAMLGGKKNLTDNEKEIQLIGLRDNYRECFIKEEEFRIKYSNISGKYSFLFSLVDCFDDYASEVFTDECHISEEGNKVIADKIKNIIEMEWLDKYGKGIPVKC